MHVSSLDLTPYKFLRDEEPTANQRTTCEIYESAVAKKQSDLAKFFRLN